MKKLTSTLAVLAKICAAQPILAFEKGDIFARAGLADVSPDDSSSNIFVGACDLSFGVEVDDNT